MSDIVMFTTDEVRELHVLVRDINSNPYCSGEIHAMGGVRAILSDSVLAKLGFTVGPVPAKVELMRSMNKKETK